MVVKMSLIIVLKKQKIAWFVIVCGRLADNATSATLVPSKTF